LNSGDVQHVFPGRIKLGIIFFKQKNIVRSVLDDIKNQTTSMVWTCSENGRREIAKRSYEMEPIRKKKTR